MKIHSLSVINANVGNPILPTNKKDPAGQFGNLRNANARLNTRYKLIKKGIRNLIATFNPILISSNSLTNNTNVYEYQLDAVRYQNINQYLQNLLYQQLLDGPTGVFKETWFLNSNLDLAYENGTQDAIVSAQRIASPDFVGDAIARQVDAISIEQVMFTRQYQDRVGLVQARVFNEMLGLSDQTKTDLADTLARGMAAGKGVRELTKDVYKRTDVSHSRAKRIVRTEVLNAYRTATSAETDEINNSVYDDSPWEMKQLWFSALAPTSRSWHISRHGSVYTTQEVKEFYDRDANAINCLCSQSPVLVNKKTGEVLQQPLIDKMKKQIS